MPDTFGGLLAEQANVVSIRAACGLVGAAVLNMALPPRSDKGAFDFNLFLHRLIAGAFLPVFVGPWALAVLKTQAPNLLLHEYPELIFFLLGSVSYFLFRWLAIWLNTKKDDNLIERQLRRRWEDTHGGAPPETDYTGPERRHGGR